MSDGVFMRAPSAQFLCSRKIISSTSHNIFQLCKLAIPYPFVLKQWNNKKITITKIKVEIISSYLEFYRSKTGKDPKVLFTWKIFQGRNILLIWHSVSVIQHINIPNSAWFFVKKELLFRRVKLLLWFFSKCRKNAMHVD